MANVIASVRARQTKSGSSLNGLLQAPMPGLGESVWVESSKLGNSYNIVGEDGSAIYVRSGADFGVSDSDVYRVATSDGADTQISGSAVGRSYGATYLALPLGDLDVLIFGRNAIARIQGDEELWRMTLSGQDGTILADAAAITGGLVTVVYQKADFSNFRAVHYKALSFSVSAPPASSNMAGWVTYPVDWDAIDAGTGTYPLASAVLAVVAPGLDYGIAAQQVRSGDGWSVDARYVVLDAYEEAGLPTVSHYGNYAAGGPVTLAQITANVTITGGSIVAASVSLVPAVQTTADIPLPVLKPTYTDWEVSEYFGFALSFEPLPPPDAFWTNLRRAVEVP